MAKVKVRRHTHLPQLQPTPPEFAWGNRSILIPKTTPSPACSFPGCRRKGVTLPSPVAYAHLKRVSRWCIYHKPNRDGIRPLNVAIPDDDPHHPPTRSYYRDPKIPICLLPGCPRYREIKLRPFDPLTGEWGDPIRWPICALHRRAFGTVAWREHVPQSVLDTFDEENKERRIRESALRREWRRAILEAKHHTIADPAGAPTVVASSQEWSPLTFWQGCHPADKTHILRVFESSVLKQRQPVEVKLEELYDRWQNYAFPKNGTPVVPYAPNPAQWKELFEWMTEQASTEEGHDRLRSQSAQEMK